VEAQAAFGVIMLTGVIAGITLAIRDLVGRCAEHDGR
jgi:hypothetical protein